MVRIINYVSKETEDGKEFFVLELQGGIETVKSQNSGKFYVTARKATISTTFNEETCKSLVGSELPGRVEKVQCDPYEYLIKDTGEVIILSHRYEYLEDELVSTPNKKNSPITVEELMSTAPSENTFSTNGVGTY